MATEHPPFSKRVLEIGFFTGLLLAVLCLAASAYYLIAFQENANEAVGATLNAAGSGKLSGDNLHLMQFSLSAHLYVSRVLLLSCGVFAGLAFGFLGFSLFLIGVQGNIDANASLGDSLQIGLVRIAPGALVMIAATILIGLCASAAVEADLSATSTAVSRPAEEISAPEDDGSAPTQVDPRDFDEIGE